MLVGIRVDASLKMGTGHTYRMLTLARNLERRGHKVLFICRRLHGNLIDLVRENFELLELPESMPTLSIREHCAHASWLEVSYELEIEQSFQAISQYLKQSEVSKLDWLVIDHYAIEQKYHLAMRPLAMRCLQVDDLADRFYDVDILIDQNYSQKGSARYDGLLPQHTNRLCGPKYTLLRDEFYSARQKLTSYETRILRHEVVIFFGGIDLVNETSKALIGLLEVNSQDHFHVIIGINNPHKHNLTKLCKEHSDRVSLHIQVSNMVDFFSSAYLYVGAVGATTWERCVMALPGLVCSVAENQTCVAEELHVLGAHYYLGLNSELTADDYRNAYKKLINDVHSLKIQSKQCAQLIEGNGGDEIILQMETLINE